MTGACENRDHRDENKVVKDQPPELVLTPTERQGLRYLASYSEQRKASANALKTVRKVMETYLFDPGSASYTAIAIGRNGAICGKFNAKNRYGAYVGFKDFVVTADGRVIASDSNGGINASSNMDYINAYLESCASKSQVAAYGSATGDSDFGGTDFNVQTFGNNDIGNDVVPEQEPDRILDAPVERDTDAPVDIPTT